MYKKVNFAFSIAEAFIMLTIVSVALAAAAPMITKQVKQNTLSNVQANILQREITRTTTSINENSLNIIDIIGEGRTSEEYAIYISDIERRTLALNNDPNIQSVRNPNNSYSMVIANLQSQLNNKASSAQWANKADNAIVRTLQKDVDGISESVEVLEQNIQNLVPAGAVMYFDLQSCPRGWSPLSNKYSNSANAFIRNQSGSGRTIGNYQTAAVPNIKGWFHSIDLVAQYGGPFYDTGGGRGIGGYGGAGEYYYRQQGMDLSRVSSVYQDNVKEFRPNNIVLLACRKN